MDEFYKSVQFQIHKFAEGSHIAIFENLNYTFDVEPFIIGLHQGSYHSYIIIIIIIIIKISFFYSLWSIGHP